MSIGDRAGQEMRSWATLIAHSQTIDPNLAVGDVTGCRTVRHVTFQHQDNIPPAGQRFVWAKVHLATT